MKKEKCQEEKLKEKVLLLQKNDEHKDKRKIKKSIKERGITLIALVITIIILLILAGVTLGTALGENGLFKRAKQAVDTYQKASQREYLEQSMLAMQMDSLSGSGSEEEDSKKIGAKLYKKSQEHSYDWHIVQVNGTNYDNTSGDWHFVKKGDDLEGYGRADHSMLIDYSTGEIKELEEGQYIELLAGDMLAVKDSIIINVDSSIVDKGTPQTQENLQNQFGQGVQLHNFNFANDDHSQSGLTNESFNFDGIDDYITIKYDNDEQKKKLADNGFTFEFYGKWNGGTSYDADSAEIEYPYKGLFCYSTENDGAKLRFGFEIYEYLNLKWNAGNQEKGLFFSDFSESTQFPYNILYPLDDDFNPADPFYCTVTVDCSKAKEVNAGSYQGALNKQQKKGLFYTQTIYINNQVVHQGDFNSDQWTAFTTEMLPGLTDFNMGRSEMGGYGSWHYSNMNAYCLRLYSRALTPEEVNTNYEKTVAYHSESVE